MEGIFRRPQLFAGRLERLKPVFAILLAAIVGLLAVSHRDWNLDKIIKSLQYVHDLRLDWGAARTGLDQHCGQAERHSGQQFQTHNLHPSRPDAKFWHHRKIERSDLTMVTSLQSGRLEVVQHPDFGSEPVLAKIGEAQLDDLFREVEFYRLLHGLHVTPLFLGHITEDGRNAGFVSEYIQAAPAEKAQRSRKEACLAALQLIHAKGLAHGDAHGENCLMRENGSAALIDFELSLVTTSQAQFDRDLWIMSHTVED